MAFKSVQEFACFVSTWASTGLGIGDEGFEDSPFVIGKVSGVGTSGRHGTATPSRFGSRILPLRTTSQTPSRHAESTGKSTRNRYPSTRKAGQQRMNIV